MNKSAETFAQLLHRAQPMHGRTNPLQNITFFLGAGFSKSWDERFPVGNELFNFTYQQWKDLDGPLEEFLILNNYSTINLDIGERMFKDLVYQIGMMMKYPELRPRYIDDQNLKMVEKHLRFLVRKKFEATAPLYFERDEKIACPSAATNEQQKILGFFDRLERSRDGSKGIPEGIRSNYVTTNYDSVIECILDSVLSPEDTYRLYTYRGITPSRYCGRPPEIKVHDNWLVGNLFKINGGFEVFMNLDESFEFDYSGLRSSDSLRENPPQIMLASREQDYTQTYFRAIFPKVIRLFQETSVLVVVGYSLPDEDAL